MTWWLLLPHSNSGSLYSHSSDLWSFMWPGPLFSFRWWWPDDSWRPFCSISKFNPKELAGSVMHKVLSHSSFNYPPIHLMFIHSSILLPFLPSFPSTSISTLSFPSLSQLSIQLLKTYIWKIYHVWNTFLSIRNTVKIKTCKFSIPVGQTEYK